MSLSTPTESARPARTDHFPIGVLLGAPLLLLLIIGALGYFYSKSVPTQNVTMGDRAYLVTVTELLELLKNTDGYDPKAEVLTKTVLARGGRELEYRYAGAKPRWQVRSRVVVELDQAQAEATFAQWAERELVFAPEVLVSRAISWGDDARLGDVQRDGVTIGHAFVGRKGHHVVLYRIEGLTLPAPLTFESVIAPHLAHAETFAL